MDSSRHSTELKAVGYMVASAFWFSVMTAIVRHLSEDMHPFQVVFFRTAAALVFMLPWIYRVGIEPFLSSTRMKLYTIRGANGLAGMLLWFYALKFIPLPTAVALSFTTPLFTTLIAVMFLKEQVGIRRWLALLVGFGGTLIILRPGMEGFHPMYVLVLIATCMWAVSNLIIKQLTTTESPEQIVFFMTLIMTPLSLPFAIPVWQSVSWSEWGWIALLGLSSNWAQLCVSKAYAGASMSFLQPFDFSRLLFAVVIGYIAFGEMIDGLTLLGALIIAASSVYITYREAQRRK